MTLSKGNIFLVTSLIWGESTGDHWTPPTKASDAELWYFLWIDQWRRAFMFSLICVRTNGCVNNRHASDLRRHHANYDVTVIINSEAFMTLCVRKISLHWDRTVSWNPSRQCIIHKTLILINDFNEETGKFAERSEPSGNHVTSVGIIR